MEVTPVRVVAVLTHPIQYYAAWFRWIAANCTALDLHVIYASRPLPAQQGVGFERSFTWDVPLTDGYRCSVVREARTSDRFDAGHFTGLDVPEIVDAIRAAAPDVVVVFGWYSATLVRAIRGARRLGLPVLYHGDTNLQSAPSGWRFPFWIVKTRRLLREFDGYLSVGVRSAAFLRFFGVADDRIFQTPHAVDNARFAAAACLRRSPERREVRRALGLPEKAFVVLLAGKLEPKKRPLDVVEALGGMTDPPHLALAGSGALESAVRGRAEACRIGFSGLGFVNQGAMPRVYAAADALVLASDTRETWGLVVNEALASGLPCIVSNSAGCVPDLAGAATGEAYGTENPVERTQALATAIERVRARIEGGHDFAPACQAAAARHSFAAATEGLRRACERVTAHGLRRGDTAASPRVIACCGSMVLVGGLERMTFEILHALRTRGAVVHCIVNWWDNHRIVALGEQFGASWSTGFYMRRLTRRAGPVDMIRMAADVIRTSCGLLRDAFCFRASHVLVSDYLTVLRNAPALMLLRLAGRRVIFRLGNAPDQGRFYGLVWRAGVRPFVDLFVCNSAFTDRELAAHGIPDCKRLTILHTAPTRRFDAEAGTRDLRRIVFVGQVIPEKGLHLLLDAAGMLVSRGHDIRVDVVGRMDGWVPPAHELYRTELRRRAAADDLAERVRFLGYREDVPALLAQAGIHCCPSTGDIREGFGIVVIEAKQAGIPSVVFRSGNLPDLVTHREDGWICAEESAEALAEGLEYYLDTANLERGMAAARRSSTAFGRDRFESSWAAVFGVDGREPEARSVPCTAPTDADGAHRVTAR